MRLSEPAAQNLREVKDRWHNGRTGFSVILRFVDGARRAPLEDVGGIPGFEEFVEAGPKCRQPERKRVTADGSLSQKTMNFPLSRPTSQSWLGAAPLAKPPSPKNAHYNAGRADTGRFTLRLLRTVLKRLSA